MKLFLRLGAPATAIAAAAIFGVLTTGSATAGEFCRQDVTGHMTGCGYDTMDQCHAASAGIGGDCFRDPWKGQKQASDPGQKQASNSGPKPTTRVVAKSNPANAYAYAPKAPQAAKRVRGNTANSAQ